MRGNRGRDTKPELRVGWLLHARGLRYLVNYAPFPGLRRRADIAFRGPKIAVFIDGCFWHDYPQHHTVGVTNGDYWKDKVAKNRIRGEDTNQALFAAGWNVLRS